MHKPEYSPDLFPHWFELPMRFRDLDPLNHVNNAIFSTYYEEARINFIHQLPALVEKLEAGFSFVLANISIEFHKPAEYPGTLLIGSGIKELGNTSITSFQAIYTSDAKNLISEAEATGVWFNLQKQRPARIPEFEGREKLMVGENYG